MIIRSKKKTKCLNESCVDDIINDALWQNDTFYRIFDSKQERHQLKKNDYLESYLRVFLASSVGVHLIQVSEQELEKYRRKKITSGWRWNEVKDLSTEKN